MTEWRPSAALAMAKLPGLPGTSRGIRKFAARAGWASRESDGSGGRQIEYATSNLSAEQRVTLERFEAQQSSPKNSQEVPDNKYDEARRKLWASVEQLSLRARDFGTARAAALARALDAYPSGGACQAAARELNLSPDHVGELLSRVERWRRDDWAAVLADRRVGRPRPQAYDCRIDELFRSDYLRTDRPPAMACWRRTLAIARAQGIPEPYPTCTTLIRRLRAEVPWQSIVHARQGANAGYRTYPAQVRDRTVLEALECVNGDGYRWNVAVLWPDGEIARPLMWYFQDTYSGKILTWRVDKTENAGLIRLAIGDLISNYCIPDVFVIDNTHAASAKLISGGSPSRHRFRVTNDDPLGLITQLNARIVNTIPRLGGSSKPGERAGGDFDRDIARDPALDGAWLGTDPTTRPDAARRPIPLSEFLAVVRDRMAEHNARPGRRTPVCRGIYSFAETFRESWAKRTDIRKPTTEQLRLSLLAAERIRVSSRDGAIELFGNRYWSEATAALAGQRVVARFDPEKLREAIFVYSLDGRFIGEAECRLPVGFLDADAAREHNRLRRQNLRRHRQILDAERRMTALQVAEALPRSSEPEPLPPNKVRALFRSKIEAPRAEDREIALLQDEVPRITVWGLKRPARSGS